MAIPGSNPTCMSHHTYRLVPLFTYGQFVLFVRGKGVVVEHQPNGVLALESHARRLTALGA